MLAVRSIYKLRTMKGCHSLSNLTILTNVPL